MLNIIKPCIYYSWIGVRFLIPLSPKLFIWLLKDFAYPRKCLLPYGILQVPQIWSSCKRTLSPLLFIVLQIFIFHNIQKEYLHKYPLAVIPFIPLFDVEFADKIVLISRNGEDMQHLLHLVQKKGARYNLHLNLGWCKFMHYNINIDIFFINGSKVAKATAVVYLGVLIDSKGRPGYEVPKKFQEAR